MTDSLPAASSRPPTPFVYIDTPDALDPLLRDLERCSELAVDTEADSMHHYREKLCLLQVSERGRHWIIDPLALGEEALDPFIRLLEGKSLLMHGADYDLRLLFRFHKFMPAQIFDTMLAAQLLGIKSFGLAALVEKYCGVILPKDAQKSDWSMRPLPPDLLAYAADDTRYLVEVVAAMRAELKEKGRLAWHEESCRRLISMACAPRAEREGEPWRVRGGRHLRGRASAVLRELWMWREDIARQLDRPAFKVAPNDLLLKFALWIEANPRALFEDAPDRPDWLRGSRRGGFEHALARALNLPGSKWPGAPVKSGSSGPRLSRTEEEVLSRLLAVRDARAKELEIDAGVLAPRDLLRPLVRERPRTRAEFDTISGLMQWQNEQLAEEILKILREVSTQ